MSSYDEERFNFPLPQLTWGVPALVGLTVEQDCNEDSDSDKEYEEYSDDYEDYKEDYGDYMVYEEDYSDYVDDEEYEYNFEEDLPIDVYVIKIN